MSDISEEKSDQILKTVMTELAEKDITDYDEVIKVAAKYGLSRVDTWILAETVSKYEKKHRFNARELSKVNFNKYSNTLLIVTGIDDVTKALIVKAGFDLKSENNSMIVFGYIDHVYGVRFQFIAPATRDETGEIEIGPTNTDLSLEFCLDSFEGKVEEYPIGAAISRKMSDKIKKIADEKKVTDAIEETRLINGLDDVRIPGYPDDVVVRFTNNNSEYESVICRIEDYDKENQKVKIKILKEPIGTYGKHIGDIIDSSLIINPNGQYILNALINNENKKETFVNREDNIKYLKATDLIVRVSKYQCVFKSHELTKNSIVVRVLNPNGIIEVELWAYYCRKCNRYYVLESDYNQLKNYGYICCRVDKYESLEHPDQSYFGKINEKSILMNYGYSVEKRKELTEEERHEILAFMIDNKVIKKGKIVDYLNWFIKVKHNQSNKQNAISKWKKDIKFVQGYRINESNDNATAFKEPIKRVRLMDTNRYVQASIDDYL